MGEARAVFINLDGATGRRAFMEAQGRRLGLALERVPAVAAADVGPKARARLDGRWERPLSAPELACFLSHRALWARVAAENRPLLILEDDVALSKRLPQLLPAILAFEGADVVNLEDFGRRRFVARRAHPAAPGLEILRTFRDKAGAAAYVLWPSGAAKLIDRAERGAAPADAFLHSAAGLAAWQSRPALAIQAQFLAARGLGAGPETPTQIQAPRRRLPLTPANWPFLGRRILAQLRLAREHLRRLGPAVYRRVDVADEDFT